MRIIPWLIAVLLLPMVVAEAQQSVRIQQWSVHGTAPLTLTLPVEQRPASVKARSADGTWHTLRPGVSEGAVEIVLGPEQMAGGPVRIVIDPPNWLVLDDAGPPAVELFAVDGQDFTSRHNVSLGWVGRLPETIVVQVRDDANPIDRGSLRVNTSVGSFRPRDEAVTFEPDGLLAGTLTVNLREIESLGAVTYGRVELLVDDYAIDDEQTMRSVSWSLSPSITLEDGSLLIVSSVTSEGRWSDWTVVADGNVMREGDASTAGVTWLSEARPDEHWFRWEFPEARDVAGVKLDWAWFEQWRTSRNYDLQIMDDGEWRTVIEVRDQEDRPMSEHRFDPVSTTGVRVLQMPMGGHGGRQNLMWLANVEVVYAD